MKSVDSLVGLLSALFFAIFLSGFGFGFYLLMRSFLGVYSLVAIPLFLPLIFFVGYLKEKNTENKKAIGKALIKMVAIAMFVVPVVMCVQNKIVSGLRLF